MDYHVIDSSYKDLPAMTVESDNLSAQFLPTSGGKLASLIYKPRGQWHTFWNAGDEPASLLEIISPAGFEKYFEELIDLFTGREPEPDLIAPIAKRFGLEVDPSSIPTLCAQHGLTFG